MRLLGNLLKALRKRYGYQSAKESFRFLVSRGLSCNYPYFMKLEKGTAIPSPQIINQIALGVRSEDAEQVVLVYCQELFPKFKHLFQPRQGLNPLPEANSDSQDTEHRGGLLQPELTLRQVHFLAEEQQRYHLFVLLTLARNGIEVKDLRVHFGDKKVDGLIQMMVNQKIAFLQTDRLFATQTDVRFPDVQQSKELAAHYRQFDLWDQSLGEQFCFEEVVKKMFLRRISVRYLGLIQKNLDLLFETVKSSDETDKRYNEGVIQLQVQLKRGRLPG